jgi:RNA polymerase sigma-70 factor (ECF subfamily)
MSLQPRDLECVRRLEAGDASALEELYDRYTPLLYPVALRILKSAAEAEDVVQQAWVQAWQGAAGYDPRRGTVAAWLLTLTRSRALDRYRSLSSRRRAETREDVIPPSAVPDPTATAAQVELSERVRKALASLQPQQRQVLEIAYFQGLSQSEIAEQLGAPLGTVKSWTRQGLMRLRELLPSEEWV